MPVLGPLSGFSSRQVHPFVSNFQLGRRDDPATVEFHKFISHEWNTFPNIMPQDTERDDLQDNWKALSMKSKVESCAGYRHKFRETVCPPELVVDAKSVSGAVTIWGLLSLRASQWILQTINRGEMRQHYGIEGSCCGDCCISFWCGCCALIQDPGGEGGWVTLKTRADWIPEATWDVLSIMGY